MEYLPFVIGIIIVAIRLYSNFQKEQEKARKRNPSQPATAPGQRDAKQPRIPPPVPPVYIPKSRPSWDVPVPTPQRTPEPRSELVKESYNPERPYEPVYTREYKEPVYPKPDIPSKVNPEMKMTPHRLEVTHLEDISEETSRNRDIHRPHKHGFQALHEEVEHGYQIDIKEAVIMQAVLNRPEY